MQQRAVLQAVGQVFTLGEIVNPVVLASPAKLNLFLAITGRRTDGFHDLVSVVAPLAWGDTLYVSPAGEFTLECDDPNVPLDESNLVFKAAQAFRAATGWAGGAHFRLEKRIPMGAGLGGGSSNAVAALQGLNRLAGMPLSTGQLADLGSKLGSDCALFLQAGPVLMRGRGEVVEPLGDHIKERVSGRRVLAFKPAFGISTPWAYGRMVAGAPGSYLSSVEAEAKVAVWLANQMPAEALLFNNMEAPAFTKHLALPAMLARLRADFGLAPRMSGSGSACFALLPDDTTAARVEEIRQAIHAGWGPEAWIIETRLA